MAGLTGHLFRNLGPLAVLPCLEPLLLQLGDESLVDSSWHLAILKLFTDLTTPPTLKTVGDAIALQVTSFD